MILVTCSGNVGRATLAGAAQSWRPTLPTGGGGLPAGAKGRATATS
jgi:hypothetical protein